jgi:hypothetical protein
MKYIVFLVLLLSGCYVGVIDPTVTPTPDPTPTREVICIWTSFAILQQDALITIVEPSTGAVHFHQERLVAGTEVIFLYEAQPKEDYRRVTAMKDGERLEGIIKRVDLPEGCQ